jgi:hypothetical protein
MAEQQHIWIGGRELQMIQPVIAAQDRFHFAGFVVNRKQLHWQMGRQSPLHHIALARVAVRTRLSARIWGRTGIGLAAVLVHSAPGPR